MSQKLRILLAVHTVADWGGLQDWTVGMVRGLVQNDAEVVLVSNNARVVSECADVTSLVFLIDWSRWEEEVGDIVDAARCDVVFSQPFKSREFSLEFRRRTGVPIVYMAHGNNSDYAYAWEGQVAKFLVASESLRPMLRDFCGVDDARIDVLPNGAPDWIFDRAPATYDERWSRGTFDFVLAARLMPDKISQVEGMIHIVSELLAHDVIPHARVHVLGGGPSKGEFLGRLTNFAEESGRVEVVSHGWVSQGEVVDVLRTAVFSVAGGVTGAQSVALGTPCLGAGIRGVCGVTTPANIDRVLGSNFGDHSARYNMTRAQIARDARWILQEQNFAEFQRAYTSVMRTTRTHAAIATLALAQIEDAIRLGKGQM
ncbi:glycosyltransferase [Cellulosimicrobium funkei]|uniref:glycosyltransferase n=1 Tax=Cellulosimicrobium funkei TaxID=264251 RepID=UPI0037BE0421